MPVARTMSGQPSQLFKHRIKPLIDPTETPKTWLLLLHIHLSSGVTFVL